MLLLTTTVFAVTMLYGKPSRQILAMLVNMTA